MAEYVFCDLDFKLTLSTSFKLPTKVSTAKLHVKIRDYIVLNEVIVRLNGQPISADPAFNGYYDKSWSVLAYINQPPTDNLFELMTTIPYGHVRAAIEYTTAEEFKFNADDGKGNVSPAITVDNDQNFWHKGYSPAAGDEVTIWFHEYGPDSPYPYIKSHWLATVVSNAERYFDTYPLDVCWLHSDGTKDEKGRVIWQLYHKRLGIIWSGPVETSLEFGAEVKGVKSNVATVTPRYTPPPPEKAVFYGTSLADKEAADIVASKVGLPAVIVPYNKPKSVSGCFIVGGPRAYSDVSWVPALFPPFTVDANDNLVSPTGEPLEGNLCSGHYYIGSPAIAEGATWVFGAHAADTLAVAQSYPSCPGVVAAKGQIVSVSYPTTPQTAGASVTISGTSKNIGTASGTFYMRLYDKDTGSKIDEKSFSASEGATFSWSFTKTMPSKSWNLKLTIER